MSLEFEIHHLRQENQMRQKLLEEKDRQIQKLLNLLEQRQAPPSPAKKPKPKPKPPSTSEDEIEYLNSSEDDEAALDTKNIVTAKRKRKHHVSKDLGMFKRAKNDDLEEQMVVYEMLDNQLWYYESREAILRGLYVENNQQNLDYYREHNDGHGYISKVYGENLNTISDLDDIDQRINDISRAMLVLKEANDAKRVIDLDTISNILYENVDFEPGDVRVQIDESLSWEMLHEDNKWRLMIPLELNHRFNIELPQDDDKDIGHLSSNESSSDESLFRRFTQMRF